MLQIHQFPHPPLENYGVLIHDPDTGETAAVDAGHGPSYLAAIAETGWTPTQIWVTHHHHDHITGLAALKAASGATVYGPAGIEGVDRVLSGGDSMSFAGRKVDVIHTPGHTKDMLNFHITSEGIVFTGDTLFVMGCGRLFEGAPSDMWASLQKLMALPGETKVYCAHEYTLSNANFAVSVDPNNMALRNRAIEVEQLREQGDPTVPSTIAAERATNPFLRCADPSIRAELGMEQANDAEVFAELRRRKDNF
ncbi:hydroxyacylglutathione hydrolase [Litoreibacter halocynthiae]|uniref:Hydroxyacylglutathione hydrolase n=1 Tax=Litoreibacter halocynthiae TaxID=1242689 RepID=A0A4R7LPX8_9RHOB|nr:hydroxyacylglutathione hydrolase [Litoreibacter halocynthiae]TDT77854.1 hydroxyacylglutathione hydrolase [Litoreibacter halocynthiae]